MTLWFSILIASALVYSWKLLGFLVPERLVSNPRFRQLASYLTVSLMAALVAIQTLGIEGGIVFDARIPAVILAGVLFWLRVPFIVVIILAALVAAALRFFL